MQMSSRCGYDISDVRKSLRDAIERRDGRAAQRWTAELIATDAAIGSLWAAYWISWASAQGADPKPVLPILLQQAWDKMVAIAQDHITAESEDSHNGHNGWVAFRNDPSVRQLAHECTARLLQQARQTPVIWPSKELILYDVSCMRDSPVPAAADSSPVLQSWERGEDAMELRLMAGRWLAALQAGELRAALSAVAWTLLPTSTQSLPQPLKVAARGPAGLPPKARSSPIWFWLDLGRAVLLDKRDVPLHRGWFTQNKTITNAFAIHWKRWTASERMRMLLAWNLQIRAALNNVAVSWEAAPVTDIAHVDLPYKEIAAEIATSPTQGCIVEESVAVKSKKADKDNKRLHQVKIESRLAEADAAVWAALGVSENDL